MTKIKRVLLVRTGGTMESTFTPGEKTKPSPRGTIDNGFIDNMRSRFNIDVISTMPLLDKTEKPILKDSTELDLPDWKAIAHSIAHHIREKEIRSVIVTHGTDSKEFTAPALTFMLENLNVPVVITGSEIPWDLIESDAPRNLANSFKAVTQLGSGVFVLFGTGILLGCRAVKVHSGSQVGFESPNYPKIGEIGGDGDLRVFVAKFANGKNHANGHQNINVFGGFSGPIHIATVSPGASPDYLYGITDSGILVSGYGLGNMPERWRNVLADLSRKIPVAITTRCLKGGVKPQAYEVGAPDSVIPCGDMTAACSLIKMRWAIGRAGGDIGEVRKLMQENVHDEITPRV